MLNWEKRPVVLLVLAALAILAGTVVTTALPFLWVNTEADRVEGVTPYGPLELAGRDVYIREGCNNCHSQTVRPLVADVLRYGPYSRSGEFVHDRPFLWGSRRAGPDLARVGGKYPDEWHERHMKDPREMVPRSNMPAYGFLQDAKIDAAFTKQKMDVLGFPYAENRIQKLDGKTEMDAMVAYLQKLGSDIGWREASEPEVSGELKNPFKPDPAVLAQGAELYSESCASCHGKELDGDIGPELTGLGIEDADLFELAYVGVQDSGMPSFASLDTVKLWKIVTFIQSKQEE